MHRRGDELAVANHEDVAGCTLGDVAALVEQDGLVESAAVCFIAGKGAIDVGSANLAARGNRFVFDATPRAYTGVQALLRVQIFAEGQGHNGKGVLIVGTYADALGALVGQRPNVDVGAEDIAPDQFHGDSAQLFCGHGKV